MGEYAGKQTVMALLVIEFHVTEDHLSGLKPQGVTLYIECGVDVILNKISVLKDGLSLHIQIRQVTEQPQFAYCTSAQVLESRMGPCVEEMQVCMVGVNRGVNIT